APVEAGRPPPRRGHELHVVSRPRGARAHLGGWAARLLDRPPMCCAQDTRDTPDESVPVRASGALLRRRALATSRRQPTTGASVTGAAPRQSTSALRRCSAVSDPPLQAKKILGLECRGQVREDRLRANRIAQ